MSTNNDSLVTIDVSSMSFAGIMEIFHSNHVAQKHLLADFNNKEVSKETVYEKWNEIEEAERTLLSKWVEAKDSIRQKQPF
tara:strand:- start:427 stop:669 length:243 start_codon:yes stop_codon:yes gene_type:complete